MSHYSQMVGVYGLAGSCWALLMVHWNLMDPISALTLLISLSIQMIGDLVFYFFLYNSNLGYSSHLFGFCTGFTLTLFLAVFSLEWDRKNLWKFVLGGIGGALMVLETVYLLVSFFQTWPPSPFKSVLARNNEDEGCCSQLWRLTVTTNQSISELRDSTYCDGDHLYFRKYR